MSRSGSESEGSRASSLEQDPPSKALLGVPARSPYRRFIVQAMADQGSAELLTKVMAPYVDKELTKAQLERMTLSLQAVMLDMAEQTFKWFDAVAAGQQRGERESGKPGGAMAVDEGKKDDKDESTKLLTEEERRGVQRKINFGFLTGMWTRMQWHEASTAAAKATYENMVIAKLKGAEAVTMRALVDGLLIQQDRWIGKVPTEADIKEVQHPLRRLYERYRALTAPPGAASAVANAVAKAFENEMMDPSFKLAAENANKAEALAIAAGGGRHGVGGGLLASAATSTPGGMAFMRSVGGRQGGRGNFRGGRGGGRFAPHHAQYGGSRTSGGVTCWTCGNQGHPQRMCPTLAGQGDHGNGSGRN